MSADGPQTPARVQINKAMVGFLTHTGYSHGGNGYEGIAFLLEQFRDVELKDPTDAAAWPRPQGDGDARSPGVQGREARAKELGAAHCARCRASTTRCSRASRSTTTRASASSPSFMAERGEYNVFHAYYRELVQALYDAGVTPLRLLRQHRRA